MSCCFSCEVFIEIETRLYDARNSGYWGAELHDEKQYRPVFSVHCAPMTSILKRLFSVTQISNPSCFGAKNPDKIRRQISQILPLLLENYVKIYPYEL